MTITHIPGWKVAACVTALVAGLLLWAAPAAAEGGNAHALPVLRSGAEIHYPPFSMVDAEGRPDGFAIELFRAALKAMGYAVTYRTGPWTEVRDWLEQGAIQALPLVARNPEREPLFDFTFPYMTLRGAIVVRGDTTDIRGLEDLRGKQVAVMAGDNTEEFLRREGYGPELRTTPSFLEALEEVSRGRCDAVFIPRLVGLRLIQETGFEDLRIVDEPVRGFHQDFCFAARDGDRETLSLLNEALAMVMADGTYRRLHAKWFAALELPRHRLVIGGDENYPPFEFLDAEERPAGYNVDLTRAIALEMGLDIEIRLGPWQRMRDALAAGEIDALQGMFYSVERDRLFDFTVPHTVNHCVPVARKKGVPLPESLADLAGKRVVVQQGDIMHDFVREAAVNVTVTAVVSQEEAIGQLAMGRHDCALVSRLTALRWIQKNHGDALRVGRRPFLSQGYCYAVKDGNKALLTQLGEGLKTIEASGAYRRIYEKWMGVYGETGVGPGDVLRYGLMVGIPLLGLVVVVFLWSWSLRRQVALKTRALHLSEEFQRAMIACSPVALYSVDLHGRVLTWNASAERMFGWRADDIIGKPLPIVPPEKETDFITLRDLVRTGQSFYGREVVRRRKDGRLFDGSLSVAPILDGTGNMVGIMGAMEDITDRKRMEENRKHWNLLFEEMGALAKIGAWEFDAVSGAGSWSREVANIHDMDPADKTNADFGVDFFQGVHRDRIKAAITDAVEKGRPYDLELEMVTAKGRHKWVRTIGKPVVKNGAVVRVRGSVQDITERKTAAQRIEHLNSVLRAIREINQLIVHERDSETLIDKGCRLLVETGGYASAMIVRTDEGNIPVSWAVAGQIARREEVTALLAAGNLPPCFDHIRAAEQDAVMIEVAGDGGGIFGTTAKVLYARMRHAEVSFGFLAAGLAEEVETNDESRALFAEMAGDLAYALHFLKKEAAHRQSETERRSLENRLIQAQKAETIGNLAGGIAHDFNNILFPILGLSEMLLETLPEGSRAHENVREIFNAGMRGSQLVKQILTFSRRSEHKMLPIRIQQILKEVFKLVRSTIPSNIEIARDVQQDCGPVMADPVQIHQVLMNLITNAFHAVEENGGKITITLSETVFTAENRAGTALLPGRYVRMTVADTGTGIAPEIREKIFEPYFTTKAQGKGTGLGLAVVFGIVQGHGGDITVDGGTESGSRFNVYLPLHESIYEKAVDAEATQTPGGKERILLVDDEPAIVRLEKQMLEGLGYQVHASASSAGALEMFRANPEGFDLVITDLTMPGLTGDRLAEEVRRLRAHMPLIICTGFSERIGHERLTAAGARFVLMKPIARMEMARAIRAALDGQSEASPSSAL